MKTLIALLLLTTALCAKTDYVCNYKRLSTREIAITCNNGGDPTGTKVGDILIISCGN